MKIRSMKYYLSEAIKSLFKNSLMSVASIITVSSCIFIFIVSYCLASNVDYLLEQLEDSIVISVFLDNELTDLEVSGLKNEILEIEHVTTIEFISSQQGLEKMLDSLGASEGLMEGIENDNPIKRSFDIYYDSAVNQKSVVASLNKIVEQQKGITKVKHFSTELLIKINNFIRIVSVIMILGMGVISIVIITNTIKLTVNNRKNEINIMKYVGATDWFIRWPFIIEGMIIGLVGATIPTVIAYVTYENITQIATQDIFSLIQDYDMRTSYYIFTFLLPVSLFLGISIGVTGSVTSIRKHLKV